MDKIYKVFGVSAIVTILIVVLAMLGAIPIWLCWTWCGLGTTYFSFLPEVWQSIPFWHCVGLMILIASVKGAMFGKVKAE